MAEIKVERKDNQQPIWPWIVGVLLLLLIVWGLVEFFQTDDDPQIATTTEVREDDDRVGVADREEVAFRGETVQRVEAFVTYVEEDEASPEMGLHHEYTSQGLERLSAALSAMAREHAPDDVEVAEKRERMERSAERIQQDPESLQHANMIRAAFLEAADLMEAIQRRSFPDQESEVEDVRSAAEDIDVETPTLEQEGDVKNFFENASEALQAMVEEGDQQRAVQTDRAVDTDRNRTMDRERNRDRQ